MNAERYMCRGKRLDNGVEVVGYIWIIDKIPPAKYHITDKSGDTHFVDPESIQPVAAKVESSGQVNKKKCPNCGIIVNPGENYCYDCGQRLDWEDGDGE